MWGLHNTRWTMSRAERNIALLQQELLFGLSPMAGIMNETVVANHLQNTLNNVQHFIFKENRNGKNVPRLFSSFSCTFELDRRGRRGTNDVSWIAVEERKQSYFVIWKIDLSEQQKKNCDCSVAQKKGLVISCTSWQIPCLFIYLQFLHTIKTVWQQWAIQIGRPSTLTHVSPTLSFAELSQPRIDD